MYIIFFPFNRKIRNICTDFDGFVAIITFLETLETPFKIHHDGSFKEQKEIPLSKHFHFWRTPGHTFDASKFQN